MQLVCTLDERLYKTVVIKCPSLHMGGGGGGLYTMKWVCSLPSELYLLISGIVHGTIIPKRLQAGVPVEEFIVKAFI